jgi:Domain of unknown function (DUF4397)
MKHIKYIFLLLALPFLSGCGEKHDFLDDIEPAPESAQLKIIHAVPGGPSVEATWKGARVGSGLVVTNPTAPIFVGITYGNAYPGTNADYALVSGGADKVVVRTLDNPNAAPPTTSTQVLSADATLDNGKLYTLLAHGTAAAPVATLIEDKFPADRNKTYVRVIHVLNAGPKVEMLISGGPVLIPSVEYGKASDFAGIDIPAPFDLIQLKLAVREPGKTTNLLLSGDLNLIKGRCYTLLIRGTNATTGGTAPTLGFFTNRF